MVELLFWICFFRLGWECKFEMDVYLLTDWTVLVVQFHAINHLMLCWVASFVLENFFRFFLVHKLFTSFGKIISPPNSSSEPFSLQRSLSYPIFIKILARFWKAQYFGLNNFGHSGDFRGGIRCQATWRSGNPSSPRPSKDPPSHKVNRCHGGWGRNGQPPSASFPTPPPHLGHGRPAPPTGHRKYYPKVARLIGGARKKKRNMQRNRLLFTSGTRSVQLSSPSVPLIGQCRPLHSFPHQVILEEDDWRPTSLKGYSSAMTWAGPDVCLESWPIPLVALNNLVDSLSLSLLPDVPIVESVGGLVTSETLLDVVKGAPISNLTIDFLVDLLYDSACRCYVLDTMASTALYAFGDWPDTGIETIVWSEYDAVLFPFHDDDHWRLGVADFTTHILYYLDSDADEAWRPKSFIRDWLMATEASHQWRQSIWPSPQQREGSADCGIAVMLFILRIARGEGLPLQGSPTSNPPVPASYSPEQLTNLRGRIFSSLLYANLDPPSDLQSLSRGLAALCLDWREYLAATVAPHDDAHVTMSSPLGCEAQSDAVFPFVPSWVEPWVDNLPSAGCPLSAGDAQELTVQATLQNLRISDVILNSPSPMPAECPSAATNARPFVGVAGAPAQPSWRAEDDSTTLASRPDADGSSQLTSVDFSALDPWSRYSASDLDGAEIHFPGYDWSWLDEDDSDSFSTVSSASTDEGASEDLSSESPLNKASAAAQRPFPSTAGAPVDRVPSLQTFSRKPHTVTMRGSCGSCPSASGATGTSWLDRESLHEWEDLEARQVAEYLDPSTKPFQQIPNAIANAYLLGEGTSQRAVGYLRSLSWPGFSDKGWDWLMSDCFFCGLESGTQDHVVRRCLHPTLQALRAVNAEALRASISVLPPSHHRVAWKIADMAADEDGYKLYLGIWSLAHVHQMDVPAYTLPTAQLLDVLWAVHRPLADLVNAIWTARSRLTFLHPPAYSPPLSTVQCRRPGRAQPGDLPSSLTPGTWTSLPQEVPPVQAGPLATVPSPVQPNSRLSHPGLRSKPKIALLHGGMNQGPRQSPAAPAFSSLSSRSLPLYEQCRPLSPHRFRVLLESDGRPEQLRRWDSASAWLGPHFQLDRWPITPLSLVDMLAGLPIAALQETPLAESYNGLVTAASLLDVAMGRPISNLTIDFIGDLITLSGCRCLVMDAVSATALYTSRIWPQDMPDWQAYDAILFPFLDLAHWRLAVADLGAASVYYLDPDEAPDWSPHNFLLDWLRTMRGGTWSQTLWPSPQQRRGAQDCGIAVIAFMVHIARGDGLPLRDPSLWAGPRALPSYTPGGLTRMRCRLFASLVYANLDPPSDLCALASGLSVLCSSSLPCVPSLQMPWTEPEDECAVLERIREERFIHRPISMRQDFAVECLIRLAQQVLAAEDFIYSVLGKRLVSSDACDDSRDSALSILDPWAGSVLPVVKRARHLSGEDEDPWRRPSAPPTSALQSLFPEVLLTVSLECSPSDLFLDPPGCFSMGRHLRGISTQRRPSSTRQPPMAADVVPIDCFRAFHAPVSPLGADSQFCIMALPRSVHPTSGIGPRTRALATHWQQLFQSSTGTRRLRSQRRRLSRLHHASSPPITLSRPRYCHRPPFAASPPLPALEPIGAGECPSLGETGPVLPVYAPLQVRTGIG